MYDIQFKRSARKELDALSPKVRDRILCEIESLAADPWPRGARKLTGSENEWRIRVGNYRVLYTVEKKVLTVSVFRVSHRQQAYD